MVFVFDAGSCSRESRPNIVVLMADDLGYGDIGGVFGNRTIPTPSIERMGKEGVSFTHSLAAASVCTPSRAAFLTSRYPLRYGMTATGRNRVFFFAASSGGLPPEETTLPEALKRIGYNTALVGKWHLGNDHHHKGDMAHHPLSHGFDYFYGLPVSNFKDFDRKSSVVTSYFPNLYLYFSTLVVIGLTSTLVLWKKERWILAILVTVMMVIPPILISLFIKSIPIINSVLMRNGDIIEQPVVMEGITERFVRESKVFMDRTRKEGGPFFLMLSFVKVHTAHFPSGRFRGRSDHGSFGDCLMELDWAVGEILDHIGQMGLGEETILLFTSDNGAHLEEVNQQGVNEGGYNGLLRGGKAQGAMEGGIRVPTIISWPNHFPHNVIQVPVSLMDFFPTILDLLHLPVPENIDGKSILSLLNGHSTTSPHHFLFHYCGVYLHGVTFVQDSEHVWKVYFYTPKYKDGNEYKCHFICHCFGSHVIHHHPPTVYNLARDVSENNQLPPHSPTHRFVIHTVTEAVTKHRLGLKEVESQFSFKNTVWRPDLQPCCNFPYCSCREYS